MKEERKRILKMVEEGKLTVDEALTLMEQLEKSQQTMEQKQGDLVKELSAYVKFEEAKKGEPIGSKHQSAKEKVIDFVDSALKKVKDFDLDFNFGKSIEISHIFQHADAYLKDLDIDVANGTVKVVPWDQSDVRVECHAKVYRVETQDQARRNFLKEVIFAIEGEKLRFSTQQKWMKLDAVIYIPKAKYENVKIRMFNGPIESQNLQVETFKAKTANGKITVHDLNSKYVEAETANGQITIKRSRVERLEAETLNGAILAEGDFKKAELQSFNGNVTCRAENEPCEFIEAKAATGSINLFVPDFAAVSGELRTNLGSFHVDIEGIEVIEEKSEVIQKMMRFKSVKEADSGLKLAADSKTGAITLKRSSAW
ncbi:DUF4097 family beta strand repeat-containing protein [Cytobacillus sp. NCCP-133]|uniref:DUF4097 family beta strand repeat-containing protein n=1 Tax=Cytobacillus sp. NCCP-133 TaxID=766848 RepID=UPI0022314179|nr:DUF4097 domain-containing protein [Cytobacillus sp. NCCP-133]GLB59823.1 hypothetical protein NCCP133_19550 [Cytobacillus sp. NCCP-133]